MDYSTFRQFADSWGLLYLTILFIGIVLFTFRPGSKKIADDVAQIPLREDDDHGKK
jgi:cytochrome c oxidase cbb3-type subunit 4